MNYGITTRVIIVKILKNLKESTINLDDCFSKNIDNYDLSIPDKKFIYNVVITTIKNINEIDQILEIFIKKLNKKEISYYLIISALCQIFYLKIKSYAVINSSCEVHKNFNSKKSTNFINGILRNIDRKKEKIILSNLSKSKYPTWFKKIIKKLSSKKRKSIYKSIAQKPTIHLIFKDKKDINLIKTRYIKTSNTSIALKENVQINSLPGYTNGRFWVQDYASTIPVNLFGNIKDKKILDMCSAPGGKAFQLIKGGAKVTAYDISKKRIDIMKTNAERLNYNLKIINKDVLEANENDKYDGILIDAPCSATGIIKRNPEILYRNKNPNFKLLTNIQHKMLKKASAILKTKGILVYAVCSIDEIEGINQIKKFLSKNYNFEICKINSSDSYNIKKLITKNGYIQSYPNDLKNFGGIDGFFIAKLIKTK